MEDMLLVITPPNRLAQLGRGVTPAHPIYRIENGRLFRMGQSNPRRGAMVLNLRGVDRVGEETALCRQVAHECGARNLCAVVCAGGSSVLKRLATQLDETLTRQGIDLYVPEYLGEHTEHARVMISSALSGGSLHCRLQEAAERFGGPERVALWVERAAEDFLLPARSGSGKALTGQELQTLRERLNPNVFFSDELCARYFTYMTGEGGAHFVLFDDGATIRKKLQVARRIGIERAVARFEQVEDLLGQ